MVSSSSPANAQKEIEARSSGSCEITHTLRIGLETTDPGSVRPFAGEGARVSIGSPEDSDAFLAVAEAYPTRN
ncbi:MAG: histidinol-phosphate aminotransferase [Actinomycetia bacterium]|nr:histidinol-phosphate aminotransferase [Actinomycetes bacterium]